MSPYPDQIEKYSIIRLIGKGAMASVYLCKTVENEHVALKWLDREHTPWIKRFNKEIQTLRALSHSNIVRYIDHGVYLDRPYLVMEFIDGVDLRVYTQKLHQRPPIERYAKCREFGKSIILALEYMHQKGIIHRDIKPSNIMISADDVPIITDFGTVKKEEAFNPDKTQLGTIIGTPSFASPEQIYGEPVTPLADQFSLGATLYYLITKQRPYSSIDRSKKVLPPSRFDPNIPPSLEATLLRMISLDSKSRFSTNQQLLQALSHKKDSGVPLAGRQDILNRINHILQEAADLKQIIVRPVGVFGSGRGWASNTLQNGAIRRNIPVFEVVDEPTAQAALMRIEEKHPLLIIDRYGIEAPIGICTFELKITPLRLADIRRSVYAFAPKTKNLAKESERLHRLSGGIPAILLPLLEQYTSEELFSLPEKVVPPPIVDDFFSDLDLDDIETLAAIAILRRASKEEDIEKISMVPADHILPQLQQRGLIQEISPKSWLLSASIFEESIYAYLPDKETLEKRAYSIQSSIPADALLARCNDIRNLAAEGKLSEAREVALENHKHSLGMKNKLPLCQSLISLGQVYLDIGLFDKAKRYFADASALAKAIENKTLKNKSHAYRARIDLELKPGSRMPISAAIDRLTPLIKGNQDPFIAAMWSWSLAALGDKKRWRQALEDGKAILPPDRPIETARSLFCMLRGACAIGDQSEALRIIDDAQSHIEGLLLFEWEFGRAKSLLTGQTPPPTSPLAFGLDQLELRALKNRWVYAKGISPDPTWND